MIRELANTLGITESQLHAAIHRAAYDSGRRDEAVTVSWARDGMEYSTNGWSMEYAPYPTSVLIAYGPTEKLAPIEEALISQLQEDAA